MKTTTKQARCLWRGKELPALSESVKRYLDAGALDVLFASNLDLENPQFHELLGLVMNSQPRNQVYIYYPNVEATDLLPSCTPSELLSHVVEDGFSEVMYIFDEVNNYLVYSNSRDSLSFWIVPEGTLTEQHFRDWDLAFESHLRTSGIGFGDEGKCYGRQLLRVLAESDSRNHRRFTPMLRALQ